MSNVPGYDSWELTGLVRDVRERVINAPAEVWDIEAREAARRLERSLVDRLRELGAFRLVAVIDDPAEPGVFAVVAYRPDHLGLLAEHFPGREVRMLDNEALSEHAQAEVRALLEMKSSGKDRDGVIVGTTDGRGGWASWNLRLFAPKPGPVPDLPTEDEDR